MEKPAIVTEEYKEKIIQKSKYFQAFANPVRLCIMYKLMENDRLCVSDFCDCMGASQPLISKHLHQLKDFGILASISQGQYVWYKLVDDDVRHILNIISTKQGGESK